MEPKNEISGTICVPYLTDYEILRSLIASVAFFIYCIAIQEEGLAPIEICLPQELYSKVGLH